MARKRGHDGGGHHGGSWKVAYADFVTAMMAFFLLMWLLNMVSTEQKAQIARYFKEFSIFESGAAFDFKTAPIPMPAPAQESKVSMQITEAESESAPAPDSPAGQALAARQQEVLDLLQKEVEGRLEAMQDQIIIDTFEGGVRIQVMDKAGRAVFPVGGAQLTAEGKRMLAVLAESLRGLGQRVAIEGHTDAQTYAGNRYTNWELSTERASAARKELETAGFNPDCLLRVSGYAATQPLIPAHPNDPRNRRISILVYNGQRCGAAGPGHAAPPAAPHAPAPPTTMPNIPLNWQPAP
ncbi:MAG: flagellar motor protein MotB [Pseudomonadota bacterium]